MPTVHLSLPEKTYRELKAKAAELGIQVTDLIKIYIRNGLEHGITGPGAGGKVRVDEIRELEKRVERLEREVRALTVSVRGKVRELEDLFNFLMERMDTLEDTMDRVIRERKMLLATDE